MIKIGKWEIPSEMFNDYVRFSIMADAYLNPNTNTSPHTDYERMLRWKLCVEQVMKKHREICKVLGIDYSEDIHDEFYSVLHMETEKQKRLKG